MRIISTFIKARVGSVFDHKQLWAFEAMAWNEFLITMVTQPFLPSVP